MGIVWEQESSKQKIRPMKRYVVMWNQRGAARKVGSKESKTKLADGWVIADEGVKEGDYNPIYDKGEVRSVRAILPKIDHGEPLGKYLKVIQIS